MNRDFRPKRRIGRYRAGRLTRIQLLPEDPAAARGLAPRRSGAEPPKRTRAGATDPGRPIPRRQMESGNEPSLAAAG